MTTTTTINNKKMLIKKRTGCHTNTHTDILTHTKRSHTNTIHITHTPAPTHISEEQISDPTHTRIYHHTDTHFSHTYTISKTYKSSRRNKKSGVPYHKYNPQAHTHNTGKPWTQHSTTTKKKFNEQFNRSLQKKKFNRSVHSKKDILKKSSISKQK